MDERDDKAIKDQLKIVGGVLPQLGAVLPQVPTIVRVSFLSITQKAVKLQQKN
jgi:hypothetical protein